MSQQQRRWSISKACPVSRLVLARLLEDTWRFVTRRRSKINGVHTRHISWRSFFCRRNKGYWNSETLLSFGILVTDLSLKHNIEVKFLHCNFIAVEWKSYFQIGFYVFSKNEIELPRSFVHFSKWVQTFKFLMKRKR